MTDAPINAFTVGGQAAAEATGVSTSPDGSGAEEIPAEKDHSPYWKHQKKAMEGYNKKAEQVAQIEDPTERKRATDLLVDRAQEASEELEAWYVKQLEADVDKYEK